MIKENFRKSTEYTSNSGYNAYFLREAEHVMNRVLRERGYMYENEIYQILGLTWDPSKENSLFLAEGKYIKYPGRFMLDYFPGSELLLIHDLNEESS